MKKLTKKERIALKFAKEYNQTHEIKIFDFHTNIPGENNFFLTDNTILHLDNQLKLSYISQVKSFEPYFQHPEIQKALGF